jgi:outer membrane lipoprotein SlyB
MIQDDSSNHVAGAVGGAVIGGFAGNTLGGGSGRRLATAGGAVAGAAAGQAVQSGWARSEGVELIIRPDNGNEFAVVQRLGETQFFVGQRVNVLSQGGNVVISPMLAQN